jgi:SAM-dependent methyltransferase
MGSFQRPLDEQPAKTESFRAAMIERPKHLPYDIDVRNRFHFYENYWKRCALELYRKHVDPKGKTVLDYGCGRGETLQYFTEAGAIATGADVDPECVRISSQHAKAVVLNPNDPVAQFGARSFDVVACFHVLEHVENPKQTLTALATIAREHVLVAVPNLRYLHGLFKREFNLAFVNEGHFQSWDHYHFLSLAERHCGLELVEWGSDATIIGGISETVTKILGSRAAIALETGIFRRVFPYHCISVLGLFKVKRP